MKLISWNVNGLRSILGKGLLEFWSGEKPDVLCLQETKAKPEQVAEVTWPRGFEPHWNSAEKPDVLCLQETKARPEQVA